MAAKNFDLQKEQYRGTLKQIMKVRGLRTISIANYLRWRNASPAVTTGIHSLKLDLQDGYINAYGYAPNGKCGDKIEDATSAEYKYAYDTVNEILNCESAIPYKAKRNIFVKLGR